MEEVYLVMLLALVGLAFTDLVVGVSNDAVNFLNSAIGSKAFSFRNILIVASLGVAVGAIFSSGLMEVARKGIFIPGQFYFDEIMVIFMAVMITDVLLLDFFNSLGLPTSTTVSIVFELLGAAVCMAFIKIYHQEGDYSKILDYINTEKAVQIILAIFLAVVLAFVLGAVIQFLARLVFSFQYQKKVKYMGAIFGGISFTAIFYFIVLKGLSSVAIVPAEIINFIVAHGLLIFFFCILVFSLLSQLLMHFKLNILKIIVIVGTFALALAFAGNDLVNFIGVPIAAWQSFGLWQEAHAATGISASEFRMTGLAGEVATPQFLLVIAGMVMVLTLWFSKKARAVVDTGVNLSRQADGAERFEPNAISRALVRYFLMLGNIVTYITPRPVQFYINRKFVAKKNRKISSIDAPAFDLVRASVNLVVASVLISFGTNFKLPLSTTYVTFMVAMGTSLADRAWGRESAVYRVAGVLNVVGGWFVTALVAFSCAAIFAALIYFGGVIAIVALIGLAIFNITRTTIIHSRKLKEAEKKKPFNRSDLITIQEMVIETSVNISEVIAGVNKMYGKTIKNLGNYDKSKLKKNKKSIRELEKEVDDLKANVFYFIKSLGDDPSMNASQFYILNLDYLQAMVQSVAYITRYSYRHVNNNHKNLKKNQVKELHRVSQHMERLFGRAEEAFTNQSFGEIKGILKEKKQLLNGVSNLLQKQIKRIRTSETSPKNSKLYFGLLLETKDLITSLMGLLELFEKFNSDAKRSKRIF